MPRFGALGRFFGNTVSTSAGFAAGVAAAPTLAPGVQEIANEAWRLHQSRPLAASTLAAGVAQGQIPYDWAQKEALNTGITKARFDHLVDVANTGPGVPTAFDLWRRDIIKEPGFRRAVSRQGLEQEWIDDLVKLKIDVLDPGQLAAAIHRGLIPDPGLLQGRQPGPDRTVDAYPVYPIPTLAEALANGYDKERLGVLVGLQGLPMGPHEAAQAYFRHIITLDDYIASLNAGNTRNEYWEAILNQTRQIPTARDFIENALRGYRTFDDAVKGTELHGMTREHAEVIFQNSGRAMNLHQITQALAYGASYNPSPNDNPDPYRQSTLVGPLRPEYYELNEALKYNLPSALYFRTLQTQGVLSQPEAERWYLRLGWPPELAEQVSKAFAKARGAADKQVTTTDLLTLRDAGMRTEAQTIAGLKALGYDDTEAQTKLDVLDARRVVTERNRVVTAIHKGFIADTISGAEALVALADLGIDEPTRNRIVPIWGIEKGLLPAEAGTPGGPPILPSILAQDLGTVTATSAQVSAQINPHGSGTVAHFVVVAPDGTLQTTPTTTLGTGSLPLTATAILSGLAPSTTYSFHVVATNAAGTVAAQDQPFTTPAGP